MKWSSVLAWRVRRHQLAERAPRAQALSVVARIAGLHAQLTVSADGTHSPPAAAEHGARHAERAKA